MRNTINHIASKFLFLPLVILMTFSSCQNEVVEVTDPSDQETLVANSALANLMQSTSLRDGSFDNIVDGANCISINLPVTITVNGVTITIESVDDYEVLEALIEQFEDDDDEIEIEFPITITLSDYEEVTINNYEELNSFIEECFGENEDDDDIECIDFQYPISISIFNSDFVVIDTVEINSDEELYNFIEDLDGGLLASINFPVTMILADGSTIVVNSNQELLVAIAEAEDTCDEDDDNDCNDDDNTDISVDNLSGLLINCSWSVDKLEIGDQDLEDQYDGYLFTFYEDGTVKAIDVNGNIDEGTWELIETSNGIKLNLQMETLTDFNNETWMLHEIEDEDGEFKIDFRNGIDRLRFEKEDCDANPAVCPEEVVDDYLAECFWRAGFNGNNNFGEYEFYFNANQELIVHHSVTDEEIVGTWTTSGAGTNDSTTITIDLGAPLGDFTGDWTVIECGEDRIKIVKNDLYIVFERECEEESCTEEQVDSYLVECIWNVVSLDGSDDLIVYDLDFSSDGVLLINGDGQTITAQWETSVTADGVWVLFDGVAGANIQAISGNWLVTECEEDRLKMFNSNNTYMIIEQDCNNNNAGDCTEEDVDGMLQACPWTISSYAGDNGFNIFNIAFNENEDAVIYTADESEVYSANWTTSQGTNGVEVTITEISGGNVQIIEGTYVVVECTPNQLILHDVNNSNNELVLDKDCQ